MKKNLFNKKSEIENLCLLTVRKVTQNKNIGSIVDITPVNDTLCNVTFKCLKVGYLDWLWTVSISKIDEDSALTVNEVNLIPTKKALIPKPSKINKTYFRKYKKAEKLIINDKATYFF
jgi:hypothetical protein